MRSVRTSDWRAGSDDRQPFSCDTTRRRYGCESGPRGGLAIALPIVVVQLGQTAMGVVDTIMVGRFSDDAMASARRALEPYPYPAELSLIAPTEATAGVPFTVSVFSYDDKGKKKPAAGVTVTGASVPTDAEGHTTVTLSDPTILAATHGKDIPSNQVWVSCVSGKCVVP